ncbi:MAG: ParB/RepB/Spo0J family partition protein [Phycisphaerae bacterium]|nr:ParB/RepB/Spo0J family partition protein [Phycisphaerae bacterium]
MQNQTTIIRIPLDKLLAHPENPNRMSKQNFEKLKRLLKSQISNLKFQYEPLIVRRHPEIENSFEIINGHHRADALRQLGQTFADCVEWNVDDQQTRVLLATLNRLGGKDELSAKIGLVKKLSEKFSSKELSRLLPDTKQTLEKLKDITKPIEGFANNPKLFLNSLIFFLDDEQLKIVETALEKAIQQSRDSLSLRGDGAVTKSEKLAKAITTICKNYK